VKNRITAFLCNGEDSCSRLSPRITASTKVSTYARIEKTLWETVLRPAKLLQTPPIGQLELGAVKA